MRPTGRGAAVLGAAALLLAGGFAAAVPLLVVLGAVAAAAVAAALLLTAGRLPVGARRSVHPDRVERGRPALARLRIRNEGPRRQAAFRATDRLGGATRTVAVRALPPGAEAVHHYELTTSARGRLTVGPLTLDREDPLGLARRRLSTGDTATLWVHPRQLPVRTPVAGHPRHHHDGPAADALRGSADLRDVREYVPGDEVRHLHWKATARTGRLMVRDLADPPQSRCTVLLDTRRGAPAEAFEEAVDLTASLLCAAARAGQRGRLLTSAGLDLPVPDGPPGVRRLLDTLAELGRDDAGDGLLTAAARHSGGTLIVVTAAAKAAVPAGLRRRFAAVVVVALGPVAAPANPVAAPAGPVPAPAGVRVLRATGAEDAVRRWSEVAG